jgi:hypothetical protein
MDVGKLRELIKDLPDSTLIVVPGADHSYRNTHASLKRVIFENDGDQMTEFYDSVVLTSADFIDACLVIE